MYFNGKASKEDRHTIKYVFHVQFLECYKAGSGKFVRSQKN